MSVEGRVAIVTGGAGGIGQALVRAFVAQGMRVAIVDVAADAAVRLENELGAERALSVPADISDPQSCPAVIRRVVERFGGLHVLVNNAALGMNVIRRDHMAGAVQIEDITPEAWQHFVEVNLNGAFFMARAAMPGFRAQRWGRIINVTTSFFTMLRPGFSPYGPAKSALEAWSASLAGELEGSGITVNVVVPGGPTDTPMVPEESGFDRRLLIRPERMAHPMLFLCSEAGGDVTGRRFVAAEWDPALPAEEAAAGAGAPAGWPDLARNPVWPGGKPAA
jgi:NAD(P)-dependent dehydrogenase (short-subunit alcohol dehydrogenase family)